MSWLSERSTLDWLLFILTGAFAVRWVLYGNGEDVFYYMAMMLPLFVAKMAIDTDQRR